MRRRHITVRSSADSNQQCCLASDANEFLLLRHPSRDGEPSLYVTVSPRAAPYPPVAIGFAWLRGTCIWLDGRTSFKFDINIVRRWWWWCISQLRPIHDPHHTQRACHLNGIKSLKDSTEYRRPRVLSSVVLQQHRAPTRIQPKMIILFPHPKFNNNRSQLYSALPPIGIWDCWPHRRPYWFETYDYCESIEGKTKWSQNDSILALPKR